MFLQQPQQSAGMQAVTSMLQLVSMLRLSTTDAVHEALRLNLGRPVLRQPLFIDELRHNHAHESFRRLPAFPCRCRLEGCAIRMYFASAAQRPQPRSCGSVDLARYLLAAAVKPLPPPCSQAGLKAAA